MTRRVFIGTGAMFGAAAVAGQAADASARRPYQAADYAALRKQLRAFYPLRARWPATSALSRI